MAPTSCVCSDEERAQPGSLRGSSLADRLGLLEGQGQYAHHIPVRRLQDIDERAFTVPLRQALR